MHFVKLKLWMRGLGVLLVFGASFALVGCGLPPLESIYKLRNVDIFTTDVEKLRVAVQMSDKFVVQWRHVQMVTSLEKTAEQPALIETFILQPVEEQRELAPLDIYRKKGRSIFAFRLAPEDIPRFNAFRLAQNVDGEKRKGSLSIGTEMCRKQNAPLSDVIVSTFIKVAEVGEFIPLTLDIDLAQELGPKKQLPLCADV